MLRSIVHLIKKIHTPIMRRCMYQRFLTSRANELEKIESWSLPDEFLETCYLIDPMLEDADGSSLILINLKFFCKNVFVEPDTALNSLMSVAQRIRGFLVRPVRGR